MALNIKITRQNDIYQNDIQQNATDHNRIRHNGIQHKDIQLYDIQHNEIEYNDSKLTFNWRHSVLWHLAFRRMTVSRMKVGR